MKFLMWGKLVRSRDGQVLIEAIVAITMILIGLLGVMSLILNSLRWNRNTNNKLIATYLAAEGIEVVKNIADSVAASGDAWNSWIGGGRWSGGLNYSSLSLGAFTEKPCGFIFNDVANAYECINGTEDRASFTRLVKVNQIDDNKVSVVSEVWWSETGGKKSVTLEDEFYNWRE